MSGPLGVHSVSIAEFDINVGNTLSVQYPKFSLHKYSVEQLANLCLPDGGHIHEEDWTYHFLEYDTEDGAEEATTLYGLGFFRNVRDSSVKRGAVQKAMLILSRQPYFKLFQPLVKAALVQHMDKKDNKTAKGLYEVLNSKLNKTMQITLWKEVYFLNIPVLKEDQFDGASLVDLVHLFKGETMVLWYGLLLGAKIMICGPSAQQVGNCCIAAPLLVAPLRGFNNIITPYVSLTDLDPIMTRKSFICGSTNLLFETKSDWFDIVGTLAGSVSVTNGIKTTAKDRQHIRNVLSGIDKGELWVRNQFENYTRAFLKSVEQSKLSRYHRQWFTEFHMTTLYQRFLSEREAEASQPVEGALEFFEKLKNPDTTNPLNKTKILFQLQQTLTDLTDIEQICDNDGVKIVSSSLEAESAQERKYAVNVLAQLALSIKGQVAILTSTVLMQVIQMLQDPMPNVANAACYCVLKISSLYIGVHALVKAGICPTLANVICASDNDNLVLKNRAAATLLQIYRFNPAAGRLAPEPFRLQLTSPDREFTTTLLELLDECGEDLPDMIDLSPTIINIIAALGTADDFTKTQAMASLQANLVANRSLVLQLIKGGGVDLILEAATTCQPESKLARLCYAVLSLCADSHSGRMKFLQLGVIPKCLDVVGSREPLFLYHSISRFLEACCQHPSTAQVFLESRGIETMISVFVQFHSKMYLNKICVPVLGTLKHLYLTVPESRNSLQTQLKDLVQFVVPPPYRLSKVPAHSGEVQDLLIAVLRKMSILDVVAESKLSSALLVSKDLVNSPGGGDAELTNGRGGDADHVGDGSERPGSLIAAAIEGKKDQWEVNPLFNQEAIADWGSSET